MIDEKPVHMSNTSRQHAFFSCSNGNFEISQLNCVKFNALLQHFMVSRSTDINSFQNSFCIFSPYSFCFTVDSTPSVFEYVQTPVLFETLAQIHYTLLYGHTVMS